MSIFGKVLIQRFYYIPKSEMESKKENHIHKYLDRNYFYYVLLLTVFLFGLTVFAASLSVLNMKFPKTKNSRKNFRTQNISDRQSPK